LLIESELIEDSKQSVRDAKKMLFESRKISKPEQLSKAKRKITIDVQRIKRVKRQDPFVRALV
jgi:hypothetical protein